MEFDFRRIDSFPPAEFERACGSSALLVQKSLEAAGELASTFVLSRKAFRRAVERLPSGHAPLDLLGQERGSGRAQRAARAYDRVRRAVDLVPTLALSTSRCLVWSSPVIRPRRRRIPGLLAVVETPLEELPEAVTELWASAFLEAVLERASGRLRRLELVIGVTEDRPEARGALLSALARGEPSGLEPLPLPGQASWQSPPLAFDRSVERLRARSRKSVLKQAFGTPMLGLTPGRRGPGLDREQVDLLLARQAGGIGAAVASDVIGPPGVSTEVAPREERALDWARLGARVALHVAQMAELGREVERLAAQAGRRHDWLAEMDLQLLPDDALRTTLEEQLGLVPAVSDLALRAELAAARLSRTYAALSGSKLSELDLGVRYPLMDLLSEFHAAAHALVLGAGTASTVDAGVEAATFQVAERHLQVFPRQGKRERASLRRAFEEVLERGDAGPSVERRIEMARVHGDEAAALFEARLPRLLASRVSPLRSLVTGSGLLRERARQLEVLVDAMLRAVALEVDRRLPRLEPGLPDGAVWHCHIEELLETVDLRGTSLAARVLARSLGEAGHQAATRLDPPRARRFTPAPVPVPLARARSLEQVVWLLVAPERIDYVGRDLDTLPCLARALDISWPPGVLPIEAPLSA